MPAFVDYCRYYKGREMHSENPFVEMFLICESMWVHFNKTQNASMQEMLSEYLRNGLLEFEQYDNTPITLKAVLYNRFRQYYEQSTIDDFKRFYIERYINQNFA